MSQGLRIWDESGSLIHDVTTRLPRILGLLTNIGGVGSYQDSGLLTGAPFLALRPLTLGNHAFNAIYVSGDTIYWDIPTTNKSLVWQVVGPPRFDVIYGVR